jgi:hypothetical protein
MKKEAIVAIKKKYEYMKGMGVGIFFESIPTPAAPI